MASHEQETLASNNEEEGEIEEEDDEDLFKQDDEEEEKGGDEPANLEKELPNDSVPENRHNEPNPQPDNGADLQDVTQHEQLPSKQDETSIPRKFVIDNTPSEVPESPAPAPAHSPASGVPPTSPSDPAVSNYGLPSGAIVPSSVDPQLLEGRLLDTLKQLPVQLINDALVEYDDAVQQKQGQIRNHGAYLYGVIKRYVSVQQRGGEGSMGSELTPIVQQRLEKLVMDGFCTQEEMNDKVKSKIRMLSEKDALFAIEELAGVDRGQIRNFGSYFMGILNRYMRGDKASGGYTNNNRGQFDRRGGKQYGARDDRRFSSGDGDYRRSRHNNVGDRKFDSYRRDRSRDRYDDYRSNNDRHHHQPHHAHQTQLYDHRQNQYMGSGQVPPPPPPPPRPYAAPGISFPQQQQQHQFIPQTGGHPRFQPASSFPGQVIPQQQQMIPGQPHMATAPPPPPPPPQMPQQQPGMQPVVQPTIQQPGMAPQPPHIQQPVPGWQPQQQQPQASPIPDILGIADKAAQALAAATTIPQTMPQQQFSSAPPHHHQPQRRGRTTAKIHELPVTVQFAVQNLQATGHVNGPLDEGILGMIKDLPEPLALQALNKFSSIDQSTMRNKTAYLAGVLRRELEKIARR